MPMLPTDDRGPGASRADAEAPLVSSEAVASYGTAPESKPAAKPKPSSHLYRTDIDGLRCVAVVAVIIYHIRAFLMPGGFLGVDVFFVISGFVVTGSLLGTPQASVCDYFSAFYARRLKRLTPALCLVVVVIEFLVPVMMGYDTDEVDLQLYYLSGQLASFGGANILYALQTATYFDQQLKRQDFNPFLHCWSLGVEEQFYLVFPGILLALFPATLIKSKSSSSSTSGSASGQHAFLPVFALTIFMMSSLVATGAAATAAVDSSSWSNFVFYLSPFRFWQLAIGALLFHGISERDAEIGGGWLQPVLRLVPGPVFAWSSFAILVLGYAFDSSSLSPLTQWVWAMMGVVACVLFIMAGAPAGKDEAPKTMPFFNQVCCTSPFVYIGRTSYQLYLWHWPAILLAEKLSMRMNETGHSYAASATAASFLGLALGIGVPLLSYHVLESPFRSHKFSSNLQAIGAFLLMIGVTCGLVGILQGGLGQVIAVNTAPGHVNTPSCPEQGEIGSFYDFIKDETANTGIWTAFGRNEKKKDGGNGTSHCYCRFCDDVVTTGHTPTFLTTDTDVNLCFSTYPGQSSLWKDSDCKLIIETEDAKNGLQTWKDFKGLMHQCLEPEPPSDVHPNRTMWLVGDSHAGALSAGLMTAVNWEFQFKFLYAPFGKDKVALFPRPEPLNEKMETLVYTELKHILHRNMKPGDVLAVMLVNFMWTEYKHATQIEELLNLTIIPRGGKLALFTDYKQERMDVSSAHKRSLKIQQDLLAKYPDYISLVDTYGLFDADCLDKDVQDGTCTEADQEIKVPGTDINAYYNDDHQTTVGSIYMWPYLCAGLEENGIM